ncbi:M20/M25/M40 family metallo-hydrolase [Granulicella sp. dw_53]|uniref:M20/M25/M40 family metallo-hydrolase n=1 Tax=Granulicella sp. dw_53 TaxID=2719792 RepID=UPI001BD5A071|nr:M20/M25/M40 family metallo-hydrolase [Granulicella sp. dw_53]
MKRRLSVLLMARKCLAYSVFLAVLSLSRLLHAGRQASSPGHLVIPAAFLLLCAVHRVEAKVAATPDTILARSDVQAAMQAIKSNEPHFIDEQVRICEIASPPFHEEKRAAELARLFKEAGLANVRIDHAGNVLGDRPGAEAHPHLVLAAHLDTVFPAETDVHVTRKGNILKGPGIGDDCRGLAALLSVIKAMNDTHIKTQGSLTFVADVGEEGPGDLRGMKELFGTTMKGQIDYFLSIEPGEANRVTNGGVGSYRYRVTFTGPGGHSYGAFGIANPIQAVGRALAHIDDLQVPTEPKTTFNAGRVGGGTSVNSIPFEAWFEFDERSPDTKSLDALDAKFKAVVHASLDEENARWKDKGKLSVKIEEIGTRPAGQTDPNTAIVTTAIASIKSLGLQEATFGSGSSDSNIPMHLGIPAITIGGGGKDQGAHSLNEIDDVTDSWKGPQNALLIVLTLLQ